MLSVAFSPFNSLLDKSKVEHVRTIGDGRPVVSGVPRRPTRHAQARVCMALEMRDFIETHTFRNDQPVSFRIGINSGPVIGGVI